MWQCLELMNATQRELVVVGPTEERKQFERVSAARYDPWLLIASGTGNEPLPHFEGREGGEGAAAYVCENMVCQLPSRSAEELEVALSGQSG